MISSGHEDELDSIILTKYSHRNDLSEIVSMRLAAENDIKILKDLLKNLEG